MASIDSATGNKKRSRVMSLSRHLACLLLALLLMSSCGEDDNWLLPPPTLPFPDADDPAEPGIPGQLAKLPAVRTPTVNEHRDRVVVRGGGLEVAVYKAPFGLVVTRLADGKTLLRSASRGKDGFAQASFSHNKGSWNTMLAWWQYRGEDGPWSHSTAMIQYQQKGDRVRFLVGQDRAGEGNLYLVVGPFYDGAVRVAVAAPRPRSTYLLSRCSADPS